MASVFNRLRHKGTKASETHDSSKQKDYALEHDPIGVGGYSQVVKARWLSRGGEVVAVKVVRKESIKDRNQYLRVLRQGFERINKHPHVCAILDWYETADKYYLTFPLLTGPELLSRINTKGRYTEEATRKITRRILETLAYIHSHGIIHRDVKPDNFLYRTPESDVDDVVLIDFGLAKILDEDADPDQLFHLEATGTPGYAAPEVFMGMAYGKNSDIFGVGVITYNLLSAWSPWKAQDAVQLLAETARADIQFPSDAFRGVSMAARQFVQTLLQPPNRRPNATQALQDPWLAQPIPSDIQYHDAEHELGHPDRVPVRPMKTLTPEHPIARQATAQMIDISGMQGYIP